jgi:predicted ABC-type ATPase
MANRSSFVMETTLSGHGATSMMHAARLVGYRTFLIYIAMKNPEIHIERVRLRASRGGHDIPDVDIRRRYERSLNRAPEALLAADEATILDNSGLQPERIVSLEKGQVVWKAGIVPEWITQLIERLAAARP